MMAAMSAPRARTVCPRRVARRRGLDARDCDGAHHVRRERLPTVLLRDLGAVDSGLYLDIARHGYTLFRCTPPNRGDWCGNAGWFPGYPCCCARWLMGGSRSSRRP